MTLVDMVDSGGHGGQWWAWWTIVDMVDNGGHGGQWWAWWTVVRQAEDSTLSKKQSMF